MIGRGKITVYLGIDLTYPHSVTVEDVGLCQAYESCVIKERHVFDPKSLLRGNIHWITRCFGAEAQLLKRAQLERVANETDVGTVCVGLWV